MPIMIYFTVADEKGDTSTIEIPFPEATLLTDIPYLVQEFADLLNPLLGGGLVGAGARLVSTVTGWTSVAAAGSDVQEKAEFVLRTAGGFIKRLNLPTFLETFFSAGSKEVDIADTDVAAFVTALEDGVDLTGAGGSGIVQPCDIREDDLDTLVDALENWGKRRK